jgi:uncharacterized protein (TIGR02145 family)
MKSISTNLWQENSGATDLSGFSAIPGGYRSSDSSFNLIKMATFFWSATEVDSYSAWNYSLVYNNTSIGRGSSSYGGKLSGYSIRCIKD